MSAPDKDQRKSLVRGWKEQERAALEALLPVGRDSLIELRAHLGREFDLGQACNHSLRLTTHWLDAHGIASKAALEALRNLGGGCDCELLANVRPDEIFGTDRVPPARVAPNKPSRTPPAATYEDDAMAITPSRPWRIVETRPGDLLTLRLGKSGSAPSLHLLKLDDGALEDLGGWCRRRWSHLHGQKWQRVRGDADEEARARATAEWAQYGFQVSAPAPFCSGAISGSSLTVSSPRRTDAYEWWLVKLPRGDRALELETEATRLANDRRAVQELVAGLSVKAPG